MHPNICTPLPEHTDGNLTKPLRSKISIIEAQLSALKSYASCEISFLHSKIESISQNLQVKNISEYLKYFRKEKPKLMKPFIRTSFRKISS